MKSSIIVTIYRSDLISRDACTDGLAWFDSMVAAQGRKHSIRWHWTPLHMVWMASVVPGYWSWARDNGLLPSLALESADLRGADLRGADLRGADLRGANLRGAYRPDGDLPDGWERGSDGYLLRKP